MSLINLEGNEHITFSNKEKVIIDFSASWCGPCKMFKPVFEETSKEHANIDFIKVDIDNSNELTEKYHIMSVPTIVVLEKGEEIKRTSGFMSKETFEEFIK